MIRWDWIKRAVLGNDNEMGASIVEYALLIVFIATAAIAVLTVLGGETSSIFDSAGAGFP